MGVSQSSSRLCKSLTSPMSSIFRAIKALFRKLRFIIAVFSRPNSSCHPILPVTSHHPSSLVQQPFLVSPPPNDYSSADDDIQQVVHRIISIPDPTCSSSTSGSGSEEIVTSLSAAVFIQENVVEGKPEEENKWEIYNKNQKEKRINNNNVVKRDGGIRLRKPYGSCHRIISIPDPTSSSSTSGSGSGSEDIVTSLSTAGFIQENVVEGNPEEENKCEIYNKNYKEKRINNNNVVKHDGGIRWIKHYSSCHRILLVGEGDFSFSLCLALVFGVASNIISTSLDSQEFLNRNYQFAPYNITELKSRECKVMHGIDATKMAKHPLLGHLKFDRIIYNFPYAGFFKNLSRKSLLRLHRRLVSQFLKNAKEMLSENGEIHITHKTNGFHSEWNLESLASSHRLRLIEAVKFNNLDYQGYNTKYGFGGDNCFNCNPSKTYKFGHETDCYLYLPL